MYLENPCAGCDLCCRKYKIYLFPKEAKAIARKLKINYKDFVLNYLDYYFELFDSTDLKTEFPKIEVHNKQYYLFSILALKQNKDGCIFLKNKLCQIYDKRPLICRLFPEYKFYDENYDFCKLDKMKRKTEDPRIFYPILKEYLKNIKHNSFVKVWKYFPEFNKNNVFVLLNGKKEEINLDIFKSIL